MPTAYWPTGGSSKPATARRKASGICVTMPAPSPVPASDPTAPRCSRWRRASSASVDDVVPGRAAQGRDHGQAAGVLLPARVVETLRRGNSAELSEQFGLLAGCAMVPSSRWCWDGTSMAQEGRKRDSGLAACGSRLGRDGTGLVAAPSPRHRRSRRYPSRCPRSLPQRRASTRDPAGRHSARLRGGAASARR